MTSLEAHRPPSAPSQYSPTDFPSMDTVVDFTREKLSAQLAHADSLDTKANFVLGSATLLTAAAVALRSSASHISLGFMHVLGVIAMVVYLAVVFASLSAYMTREYHQAPNPVELEPYIWEEPLKTKGDTLREMVKAYKENKTILQNKARWLKWSLLGFGLEAVLLAVLAIAQILN